MSADTHATAILAAINAQFAATRAYDLDNLPNPRPAYYVEVIVSRRFGGEERADGYRGTTGWRVTTRAVGKTVSNARLAHEKARLGLEDVSLTIGALTTTPVKFEAEVETVGPDDGWYSGLIAWTYTL